MANSIIVSAAKATPIVAAAAVALPEIAGMLVVGTLCLGGLMIVSRLTQTSADAEFDPAKRSFKFGVRPFKG